MITLLATIFVLSVLVFVHELGHFLSAKGFGIRVERFSIGYPPRLFGKRRGDTDYCISAVPFGGYVKIAGMVDESLDTKAIQGPPQPWEFRSKPWLQRLIVVLAGSLMNLLLAYLILTAFARFQGVGRISGTTVGIVTEGRPAAGAGLKPDDRIVRVNGDSVATWEALTRHIHSSPGKTLRIEWMSGDSLRSALITPLPDTLDGRPVGLIGIQAKSEVVKIGWPAAFVESAKYCWQITRLIAGSLVRLVTGQDSLKTLGGPVKIAQLAGDSARQGMGPLFYLMALLSINLGLLNLLPFPVLDGGHVLILCIEGIVRKEIPVRVKMIIQQAGMVLLIGLILLVTYNDIFTH
jgi:regulator of sigma E protease